MEKHRSTLIAAFTVLIVMTFTFVYGGRFSKSDSAGAGGQEAAASAVQDVGGQADVGSQGESEAAGTGTGTGTGTDVGAGMGSGTATEASAQSTSVGSAATDMQAGASAADAQAVAAVMDTQTSADVTLTQDKYLTDPIPDGKPAPVEPQDVGAFGDEAFTVTITVRCDTILDNMRLLHKDKWDLIPEDGVILPVTQADAYEGESVFNILQREMRRARIHMEFMNTPIYNSAYIEGIHNLYEFDVGELSGWMYQVNGWYPNYGCSRYKVEPGDVIEWHYTCDLGRDLGAGFNMGWQQDQ